MSQTSHAKPPCFVHPNFPVQIAGSKMKSRKFARPIGTYVSATTNIQARSQPVVRGRDRSTVGQIKNLSPGYSWERRVNTLLINRGHPFRKCPIIISGRSSTFSMFDELLSTSPSKFVLFAQLISVYWVSLILYRLFLHPLRSFPGNKLAAMTAWHWDYYGSNQ